MSVGADATDTLGITYALESDRVRKDDNKIYKLMMTRHKKLFALPLMKWAINYDTGRKLALAFFGTKHDKKTAFPSWIKKTDEVRIENVPFYLNSKEQWTITEKLDGTSCTYTIKKKWGGYEFYVCSRNRKIINEKQECYHDTNIYWELAKKYGIKNKLITFAKEYDYKTVILQGEGIGFVQGNPYKFTENDLYIFNLITDGNRWSTLEMTEWCQEHQVKAVLIINKWAYLPEIMENIKRCGRHISNSHG